MTTSTLSSSSISHEGRKATILRRAGLERLGRFQFGEVIFEVEVSIPYQDHQKTTIHEVDYDHILDFVTLGELERFENAQFEQELIKADAPSLPNGVKKRGRPPKAALVAVGISSDEESESPSVPEDGIVVQIPTLNPLKRQRSSSPIRGRGRPKKVKSEQLPSRLWDTLDYNTNNSACNQIRLDAGSDQLVLEAVQPDEDDLTDELSSIPVGSNSHFKSSQLVAASQRTENEAPDAFHQHQPSSAKKPGRGRPRKHRQPVVELSEDDDLDMLHEQFQMRRPGRSTRIYSATDDELGSPHPKFGGTSGRAASSLLNHDTPRSFKQNSTFEHVPSTKCGTSTSTIHSIHEAKPSPKNRPGYRPPSLSKPTMQSTGNNASASSDSSCSSPVSARQTPSLPRLKIQDQNPIVISSDDSSSSPAAAYSHPKGDTVPIPEGWIMPSPVPPPSAIGQDVETQSHGNCTLNEDGSSEPFSSESSSSEESESEESENETAAIIDVELPEIPSSQSFIVSKSPSSSDSESPDRTTRPPLAKAHQIPSSTSAPRKKPSISMQKISEQVAKKSRAEVEAKRQRAQQKGNRIRNDNVDVQSSSTAKARVSREISPVNMLKISREVAKRSRQQVEAKKLKERLDRQRSLEAKAHQESTSDTDSSQNNYRKPPDHPPAGRPTSSFLAARTKPTQTPSKSAPPKPQSEPKSYAYIFKQFATAHNAQQQQPYSSTTTTTSKVAQNPRPSAESARKAQTQAEPQAKPQAKPHTNSSSRSAHHNSSEREDSSSPPIPIHREASISLGDTPSPRPQARRNREPSIDLGAPTPPPVVKAKLTGTSTATSKKASASEKQKKMERTKGHRVSMTPLFPAAARMDSPLQKGRRPFSTREFEGET